MAERNELKRPPKIKRRRAPQNNRQLDELLQHATKQQIASTYWGEEKRLLNFVDKKYLGTMSKREQSFWYQARQAVKCKSRKYDHISVKSLVSREPPNPAKPWRPDYKQVKRDREVFNAGGYQDGRLPHRQYYYLVHTHKERERVRVKFK